MGSLGINHILRGIARTTCIRNVLVVVLRGGSFHSTRVGANSNKHSLRARWHNTYDQPMNGKYTNISQRFQAPSDPLKQYLNYTYNLGYCIWIFWLVS